MKKILIISFLFLSTAILPAQNINNVTIKTTVKAEGFDGIITWYINNGKLAFDVEYEFNGTLYSSRFIPDLNSGMLNILTHTGGMKMKSSAPASDIQPTASFDRNILEIERLGDAEFSGIACQKFIIRTSNNIIECYIDPGININYYNYESFIKSDHALLALKDLRMKGFPIAVKTTDLEGKIINVVETIDMRVNSVSDDIFRIGSEYKTFEELNPMPVQE
ncbi:MAG: DUF4412 domain-containing protein [Bacteroidales bacterium]|nr:DUF4412 domain-containing protein [Bacteroidales bacterium]